MARAWIQDKVRVMRALGNDTEKAIVKATNRDKVAPKEKHVSSCASLPFAPSLCPFPVRLCLCAGAFSVPLTRALVCFAPRSAGILNTLFRQEDQVHVIMETLKKRLQASSWVVCGDSLLFFPVFFSLSSLCCARGVCERERVCVFVCARACE